MPSIKELLENQKTIRRNAKERSYGPATRKTAAGKRKTVRQSAEPSVSSTSEPEAPPEAQG